jgi:ABC-type spermidine/putrescine transport system permease subunit II
MGFDLWQAMGVSRTVGLAIALGGVATAVLLAIGIAMRRGKSPIARIGISEDR